MSGGAGEPGLLSGLGGSSSHFQPCRKAGLHLEAGQEIGESEPSSASFSEQRPHFLTRSEVPDPADFSRPERKLQSSVMGAPLWGQMQPAKRKKKKAMRRVPGQM